VDDSVLVTLCRSIGVVSNMNLEYFTADYATRFRSGWQTACLVEPNVFMCITNSVVVNSVPQVYFLQGGFQSDCDRAGPGRKFDTSSAV